VLTPERKKGPEGMNVFRHVSSQFRNHAASLQFSAKHTQCISYSLFQTSCGSPPISVTRQCKPLFWETVSETSFLILQDLLLCQPYPIQVRLLVVEVHWECVNLSSVSASTIDLLALRTHVNFTMFCLCQKIPSDAFLAVLPLVVLEDFSCMETWHLRNSRP
jgi:hypothetical protein